MKKTIIITLFFVPLSLIAQVMADFNVLPRPQECLPQKGDPFVLADAQSVSYTGGEDMCRNASFLAEYIAEATQKTIPVTEGKRKAPSIFLSLNKKMTAQEGYRISVSRKGIIVEGATPQGVFYGIQTLRKALPYAPAGQIQVPAVIVNDEPRFSYRGMHLDVSRHFFGVDVIKQYIDRLALHNMNIFHFHLTDDQGWRVPVEKYPRLTEVGAYRNKTVIGRNTGLYNYDRYGGFYTKEQLKEIVEYARQRYITIIPEIDMPGHMEAALAAYPQLGCTGGPYEVEANWGVFDDILCAGKEEAFKMVEAVLDVIMDIFPSEYIHIGGDEAPRTRWKACPLCQQRIRQLGLKADDHHSAEDRLQGYFMKRVEKYLNDHGHKAIGWDELLDCDVDETTTIMSWRGQEGGLAASEKGHDVIMTPTSFCYFDYYQTPEEDWSKPLLIGGFVPLDKVYSLEPAPATLSANARKHIIGVQANLWTEYICDRELLEYQTLPRMGALAELQWVLPEKKNYDEYLARQKRMFDIYQKYGWKYCAAAFK